MMQIIKAKNKDEKFTLTYTIKDRVRGRTLYLIGGALAGMVT